MDIGNSSSASTGGTNLPLRRKGCSAATAATRRETADTIDHFMTTIKDLKKLKPKETGTRRSGRSTRKGMGGKKEMSELYSTQVFIHDYSLWWLAEPT